MSYADIFTLASALEIQVGQRKRPKQQILTKNLVGVGYDLYGRHLETICQISRQPDDKKLNEKVF